jgi:uncharacterized protein (DUF58 family)
MSATLGWALAAAAVAAGWFGWGWPGVVLALTITVFWLVLQFNRAVRVMRSASAAPVGHVASAVMLHARLQPRMTLVQVIGLTKSLGRRVSDAPEVWAWTDAGGNTLQVTLDGGRVAQWSLARAEVGDGGADGTAA